MILNTGNNEPQDIYELSQTSSYVNNPYPIKRMLKPLNKQCSIGIIGNSLTAIDIAISLKNLGHQGLICMLSRRYASPRVRGKITKRLLSYLTVENIESIKTKKGSFSILDALRLLRKEMREVSCDWRYIFRENDKEISAFRLLEEELAASFKERKWQSLLISTNEIIEYLWNALDSNSKIIFIERYHRIWLCNRSPIPSSNARKLLSLLGQQLSVLHGLERIVFYKAENSYRAYFRNSGCKTFDIIINATGPSNKIDVGTNQFLHNLIKNGLLKENIFGGVEIDFESSSAISGNGFVNHNIKVIGHATVGVYHYTSSLEMIVKNSKKIAKDLFALLTTKSEQND